MDTVKPSTSITISPSSPDGTNGWRVSATSFTLGGSDATSGVASTFYKVDGGATQTYTGSAVSIPQGSHTVSYWSVDTAGNTESATTTPAINVDLVKPSTTLTTSPASPDGTNNWFKQSSVTFTLAATDATSGVANRFYTIDGGSQQTYSGTVTVSTQGDHTVTYWSVDNAGNTETTNTTHIKLDNVKPATTLTTSPASPDGTNNWFKQSSVTFSLSASDASSGSATTLYTVDGGAQQTYSGTVTVSTQGDHTVTYWSVDNAGNTETTNTTHIKLDNVKPATTLTTSPASPDGTNNWFKQSSVTFTLAATDATSGVANRFYTIDGGSQQTYSGTVTVSTQGDHTVTYWSVDNAGNTETTNTTHIKLDNVAPTNSLALTNKTGGSFVNGNTVYYRGAAAGSFSIQNTVADATSGAASSSFPALGGTTTNWTHTAPDVKTTPSGGPYVSNLFSWTAATISSPTEAVTGADAAGNTAAAPTLTFTNDSTVPATTDNTASIGSTCKNTTQTVTLSPTDAASGVAATYYTTNGSAPTTSSSQGTSISLSADGNYTIKYFTVDNVGNTETVKTARLDDLHRQDRTGTDQRRPGQRRNRGDGRLGGHTDDHVLGGARRHHLLLDLGERFDSDDHGRLGRRPDRRHRRQRHADDHGRRCGELRRHGQLPRRLDRARWQLRDHHPDVQLSHVPAPMESGRTDAADQARHGQRSGEHGRRRRHAGLLARLRPQGHRGQHDRHERVQRTRNVALLTRHPT